MQSSANWDWSPGERVVCETGQCNQDFQWIEEPQASPDGEKLAAVVNLGEEGATLCVNGEAWEKVFEKAWDAVFSADVRLSGLVSQDMEWTVAVDGEAWEETFGFVWNTQFSRDGKTIAVAVQRDMQYGLAVDGQPWETLYESGQDFVLSPNGRKTAAVVQVESLPQADTKKFLEGLYQLAVDGELLGDRFVNLWKPVFDADAENVACQIRHNHFDYSIAVNGKSWTRNFGMVWEPVFHPATGAVVAPVRLAGKWGMAQDGEIIWPTALFNCWHQQFSAAGGKLYAIVSPEFGRWTIAVDNQPWSVNVGGFVNEMVLSPDGNRAAAVCNDNYKYSSMADGKSGSGWYEMAYAPVFSPDSAHIAAKVERPGKKFTILMDNKPYKRDFDLVFDPVFSPGSDKLLIKAIDGGKLLRIVVPLGQI